MAKFTIYSPDGAALYTGTPSFTGQYMKPGMLEFREIASPRLIDFSAGCYVGYEVNGSVVPQYSRTGFTYKLYSVPQVKKQARPYSYGAAFVYQGVQFFDASKELELCPFRDLVTGDNRIHFSTQPSISTFEGCDGLARRFEACLREQYDVNGVQSWQVRIATTSDGVTQDFYDLMCDAREFTVSGVNILQCLDKIYEIWPEVGWIYTVESVGGRPTNTIIIGGAGLNANQGTYAYGKGRGLTSITRTVANADEMANRIYAYGSSRNMLPKWYNRQNIKDAQSVDIQNLMIPIARWGTTQVSGSNLPDASKAYVENTDSIDRIGLRPKTAYFDGSGEYPEIYPSIRKKTIGDLWSVMSSSAQFYPSHAIYSSGDRIDTVLSAQETYDSGLAGNTPGKANVEMGDAPFSASGSFDMSAGITYYPFYHYQGTWTPETAGIQTVAWKLDISGQVQLDGIEKVVVSVDVKDPSYQGPIILANEYELTPDESGIVTLSGMDMYAEKVNVSAVDYYVHVDVSVYMTAQETDKTGTYTANGNVGFALQNYRKKTFTISLRQIGFDINAQSALSDGKSISMRSGKCQGRTFTIKNVQYDSYNDAWNLECFRSEDESLSQWFPNTDYPVRGKEQDYDGDEFVLLDIAMPELYVILAENELYQAALDLLSDTAVERWQYVPEIDAKYMVENSRVIRSGEYMAILDMDFIEAAPDTVSYFLTNDSKYLLTSNGERIRLDDGSGSVTTALVDTIVINEGEATIPTYKVTLRDRKKKTWTESKGAEVPASKSVGSITDTKTTQTSSSSADSKYFMLDDNGNITLKPQYSNLWVPGWMAAGGVGSGSGGGGGVTSLYALDEVLSTTNPSTNQIFYFNGSKWTSIALKTINSTSLLGSGNINIQGGGSTYYAGTGISIGSNNYISISSAYQQNIGKGVDAYNSISALADRITAIEDWFEVVTVSGQSALHAKSGRAIYSDSWMASGGVGSGSSGGGSYYAGTGINIDSNNYISIKTASTSQLGGVKVDGTTITINNGVISAVGGGGGGISSVSLASGTNNGTLKLTVDGTVTDNIAVKGLGSLAYKSSLSASDIPSLNYLPLSGGELTGDLRLRTGGGTSGSTLRFGDGDYAYIQEPSNQNDHLTMYARTGITLSTGSGYGIDIGNARLVYDSSTNALHVTKIPDTEGTVGLYVDGFVASGGAAGSSNVPDELNYDDGRLYIQRNGKDLCLTAASHTIIGSYPGSDVVGSNKLYVVGTAMATSWNTTSDFRLKDDITSLKKDEAIEKLMALKPSMWKWNSGLAKGMTASGFIAQEVEAVLPFMVTGEDYKGLAYQMLHAYEVSAIQSHEERINALEKKVKTMEG